MHNEDPSKSRRDQRGAAFHEAGHAVVASALGLAIGRIEIAIDGDDAKGEADIQDNSELCLIDQIAVCAAGLEAQRLFEAPTHEGAGWGDYGKMIELLEDLEDEESRQIRYDGHQRAHDLLVQHADKVERLANTLLEKRRLGQDELRNILESELVSAGAGPDQCMI
jgi:ATP-dependent Zn protease